MESNENNYIRDDNSIGRDSDFMGYRGNDKRNRDRRTESNERRNDRKANERLDRQEGFEGRIKKMLFPDDPYYFG